MFSDVLLYSSENIGEEQNKKRVFTFSDVLYSSENIVVEQNMLGVKFRDRVVIFFRGYLISPLKTLNVENQSSRESRPGVTNVFAIADHFVTYQ